MAQVERPVLRYFGGKWALAPWVISRFPPHEIYLEPFGGGASILLRKDKSYAEIYNDLDGDIVNLFRVLQSREKAADLVERLRMTPFARSEFEQAYEETEDDIERARRTIIRSHFGIGETATTGYRTGFRSNSFASGTHIGQTWMSYVDALPQVTERLRSVVIENKDALELMRAIDKPSVLHLVDPPYVHSTRVVRKGYRHEMTDEHHAELCTVLKDLTGMVILCGYENSIYESLGWELFTCKTVTGNTGERTEALWINPAAMKAQAQIDLFAGTHAAGAHGNSKTVKE